MRLGWPLSNDSWKEEIKNKGEKARDLSDFVLNKGGLNNNKKNNNNSNSKFNNRGNDRNGGDEKLTRKDRKAAG